MLLSEVSSGNAERDATCSKIDEKVSFLHSGGSMIEQDSRKIRSELHGVFAGALDTLFRKMNC